MSTIPSFELINNTTFGVEIEMTGITRQALADKTGLNLRTIEAYEQRKNDINNAAVSSVKKIALVLGVPIEKIID